METLNKFIIKIEKSTYFLIILFLLVFSSCNNSGDISVSEKELELQKKELDLKQKELDLKEKQLAFDSAQNAQKPSAASNTTINAKFAISKGALVLNINEKPFIVAKDWDAPESALVQGKEEGSIALAYIMGASGIGTTYKATLEKNGEIKVVEILTGRSNGESHIESHELLRIKQNQY